MQLPNCTRETSFAGARNRAPMRLSGRAAGVWALVCRFRCSRAATSSSCCSAAAICSGSSAYLQVRSLPDALLCNHGSIPWSSHANHQATCCPELLISRAEGTHCCLASPCHCAFISAVGFAAGSREMHQLGKRQARQFPSCRDQASVASAARSRLSCHDWNAVHDSRPDQMMRPALRSTSSRASLSCRTLSMSTLRPV